MTDWQQPTEPQPADRHRADFREPDRRRLCDPPLEDDQTVNYRLED